MVPFHERTCCLGLRIGVAERVLSWVLGFSGAECHVCGPGIAERVLLWLLGDRVLFTVLFWRSVLWKANH